MRHFIQLRFKVNFEIDFRLNKTKVDIGLAVLLKLHDGAVSTTMVNLFWSTTAKFVWFAAF